jgi:hypothetical protein
VLVYLLCPLMMLICCAGMMRPGKRADAGKASRADCCAEQAPRPTLAVGRGVSRGQEIARLRADLVELSQRLDRLEAERDEQDDARPARRAAGSGASR